MTGTNSSSSSSNNPTQQQVSPCQHKGQQATFGPHLPLRHQPSRHIQQLSVAAQRAWQLQLQHARLPLVLAAAAASVPLQRVMPLLVMHWAVVWQQDSLQQSLFL
jgi:hypothetical protein